LLNFFSPGERVSIGRIAINPFLKSHDAVDPCSFSITCENKTVAVMTDIGSKCVNVIDHIRNADAVFLESNYDDDMLWSGFYPPYLKKRISSDSGHLSNTQAAKLTLEHASSRLKHVFLSHLSANNNTPELALSTFCRFISQRSDLDVEVTLTSREKEIGLVAVV
jgi:phosphoribosyl 1,2-cyclic phosphodiesterase